MASGKMRHGYKQNERKCKQYRADNRREHNKLKRILRVNGREYAEKWCEEHGVPKSWIPAVPS